MFKKKLMGLLTCGIILTSTILPVSAKTQVFTKTVSMDLKMDAVTLSYETLTSEVEAGKRDYLYKKRERTDKLLPVYYYRPGSNNVINIHYEANSLYSQRKTVQIRDFALAEYNTKTKQTRTLKNDSLSLLGDSLKYHYLAYNTNFTQESTSEGISKLFKGGTILRKSDSVTWDMKFSLAEAEHNVALKYTPSAAMKGPAATIEATSLNTLGENAFYLIPDKEPPKVIGADIFDDIRDGFVSWDNPIDAILQITDNASGVSDGKIVIKNTNTNQEKTIGIAAGDSTVTITMDPDDPLFSGDTEITITIYDNVGNTFNKTYTLSMFTLESWVESNFIPYNNTFWTGEDGRLLIKTEGFVDYVEVTFPDDLVPMYYVYDGETEKMYSSLEDGEERLPKTFKIDFSERSKDERIDTVYFKIPDEEELAGNLYRIKVTAYKNGKDLTVNPELTVIGYSGDYSHTRVQ